MGEIKTDRIRSVTIVWSLISEVTLSVLHLQVTKDRKVVEVVSFNVVDVKEVIGTCKTKVAVVNETVTSN